MSLLLFFRARTAFARDTLACDITSSMSFTSTPVSSTYALRQNVSIYTFDSQLALQFTIISRGIGLLDWAHKLPH